MNHYKVAHDIDARGFSCFFPPIRRTHTRQRCALSFERQCQSMLIAREYRDPIVIFAALASRNRIFRVLRRNARMDKDRETAKPLVQYRRIKVPGMRTREIEIYGNFSRNDF